MERSLELLHTALACLSVSLLGSRRERWHGICLVSSPLDACLLITCLYHGDPWHVDEELASRIYHRRGNSSLLKVYRSLHTCQGTSPKQQEYCSEVGMVYSESGKSFSVLLLWSDYIVLSRKKSTIQGRHSRCRPQCPCRHPVSFCCM